MDDSRPNILVIVMDTARFDTVDEAMSDGIMPNIGRISDDGTFYTECWANAPWTLPSHASMFTGQYASDHGLMDHQYCIREPLTRVPLLCRYPPVFSDAESDALIELRDLYPTISYLAGRGPFCGTTNGFPAGYPDTR